MVGTGLRSVRALAEANGGRMMNTPQNVQRRWTTEVHQSRRTSHWRA
jgi:hypothetical protein